MKRKTVSAVMLTLLLISMLSLTFNIQSARTEPRTTAIQTQSLVGVITDPIVDVTIEDATSVNFDITKVSFSIEQGNLIIEFEVSGVITQGGYFVLFDTDQDTSTGCSGHREIDDFIGTDYFIHFNPTSVPAAQLCSSYRPWVRIKGLRYDLNENIVTFYLPLSDIGFSGDLIEFDVVARTFLHWGEKIYKDRAPDTEVFTCMHAWSPKLPPEEVLFWMQWWFWTIVTAGIVVLAGAVYFLKKRKPPTPTAPTLPPEVT